MGFLCSGCPDLKKLEQCSPFMKYDNIVPHKLNNGFGERNKKIRFIMQNYSLREKLCGG